MNHAEVIFTARLKTLACISASVAIKCACKNEKYRKPNGQKVRLLQIME